METYKPYTPPCIDIVKVELESAVLEGSYRLSGTTGTQNLDEDDEEFVW